MSSTPALSNWAPVLATIAATGALAIAGVARRGGSAAIELVEIMVGGYSISVPLSVSDSIMDAIEYFVSRGDIPDTTTQGAFEAWINKRSTAAKRALRVHHSTKEGRSDAQRELEHLSKLRFVQGFLGSTYGTLVVRMSNAVVDDGDVVRVHRMPLPHLARAGMNPDTIWEVIHIGPSQVVFLGGLDRTYRRMPGRGTVEVPMRDLRTLLVQHDVHGTADISIEKEAKA